MVMIPIYNFHSTDPDQLYLEAINYYKEGKYDQASKHASDSLMLSYRAQQPVDLKRCQFFAVAMLKTGDDYPKAIKELNDTIQTRSKQQKSPDPDDYYWLAVAYFKHSILLKSQGNSDFERVAKQACISAEVGMAMRQKQSQAQDANDHYLLCAIHQHGGRYASATLELNAAMELNANQNPDDYARKANLFVQKGEYNEGICSYSEAISVRSKQNEQPNASDYYYRARAYVLLGKWQEALNDCSTVNTLLETQGKRPSPHNYTLRQQINWQLGNYIDAIKDRVAVFYSETLGKEDIMEEITPYLHSQQKAFAFSRVLAGQKQLHALEMKIKRGKNGQREYKQRNQQSVYLAIPCEPPAATSFPQSIFPEEERVKSDSDKNSSTTSKRLK